MIARDLKLRPTPSQEAVLSDWLWVLTGVWNWCSRKIQQDASDGLFHSAYELQAATTGHATKIGLPSRTLQSLIAGVCDAWKRYFRKQNKHPKLKSARRPLRSIPFPDPIKAPVGNRITLPILGKLRFHKQDIPKGRIKCGRIVKRASGWYLCLFIDAQRAPIVRKGTGSVGIDPGFSKLLTLSTGEKIEHPRELEAAAKRLAQAQRGRSKRLTARIQEQIANQKKDRNHKLSRWLVENFTAIYFSKDNTKIIAKRFGKSVSSSNHYQLRQMLSYKSPAGGSEFVEVDSKFSTRICSSCGAPSGPQGLAGLSVRHWGCSSCGATHDRDINAAINTLNVGAGRAHERVAETRQEAATCGASRVEAYG